MELAFGEAEFFESQGDLKEAGNIYEELASWNKEDVYIIIRWEQFLMRQNRIGETKSLLNSSMEFFTGTSLSILLDHMNTFYTKVLGEPDFMVDIYKKSVENSPKFNRHLILGYLILLINGEKKRGENLGKVVELFDLLVPRMKEVWLFFIFFKD